MAGPSIKDAQAAYLLDCKARNLRPASLNTYRRQLGAFTTFADDAGIAELDQVTPNVLRAYIAHLADRGLRPTSIRSHGRVLRIFLNFCTAEGMTTESPARRLRMPRQDRPRPDCFTAEEIRNILGAATCNRDRAIVLCLLDTGCRIAEFTAWSLGDITGPAVTVRHDTSKSRMTRTVYLGRHARAALDAYLAEVRPADRVWLSRTTGQPMTVDGMKAAVQNLGARARVQPAGPHKYRRTFAVYALQSGMDLFTLKDLMGHSTIDLLKHYVTADDAALAAAHAKHGPVDHLLK